MNTPLVSVLMAAYNAEEFIGEAIRSALHQTYPMWELVIVNDGSTDGTREAVLPYLSDARIKYVEEENCGVSAARNKAFTLSRGTYVTFLDTDDLYHPRKLEAETAFLDARPEYEAVYCRFASFYEHDTTRMFDYRRRRYEGNLLPYLLRWSLINPNTVMIRREAFARVRGFDSTFRDAEDWDLWLRLSVAGARFGFVDETLHYNRLRRGSHSRMENQVKMKASNVRSLERTVAAMSEAERKAYRAAASIRRARLRLALAHLANNDSKGFRRAVRAAHGGGWRRVLYGLLAATIGIFPAVWLGCLVRAAWRARQRRVLGG